MADDTNDPKDGIVASLGEALEFAKLIVEGDAKTKPAAERGRCLHRGWVVNANNRTLKCQECGSDIDPFKALARVARQYDEVRDAQKEHRRLLEKNRQLEDEEKRIKARTKNASRKEAKIAVEAERKLWQDKLARVTDHAAGIEELARKVQRATNPQPTPRFCRKCRSRDGYIQEMATGEGWCSWTGRLIPCPKCRPREHAYAEKYAEKQRDTGEARARPGKDGSDGKG